jgi:peptide/nickel transport system substrate-binding protein
LKENYHNFGKAAYRLQATNDEPSIQMYPYNPNLAAKLLDNSGWRLNNDGKRFKNGERLSFEIVTDDYPVHINLAKTIERLWLNLGITVQVKVVDSQDFKEEILKKRMFRDIALVAFSHVPSTYWFGRFHSRQIPDSKNKFEGLNFGSWENPKMNQLVSDYETTYQFDLQRRIENQIMVEIYRDLPILPLIYRPRLMIVHENVGNVTLLGHNYHASLRSSDWIKIKIKRDRETF